MDNLHCVYCKKRPGEIKEIVREAKKKGISFSNYARNYYPVYDSQTDLLCCWDCYGNIGYPAERDLWKIFKIYKDKTLLLQRKSKKCARCYQEKYLNDFGFKYCIECEVELN